MTRIYIYQGAFLIALSASILLISKSNETYKLVANIIYSLSLSGMYGISALYHCTLWSRKNYLWIRSIDHAAIYALIAGTASPICVIGLNTEPALRLLVLMWLIAFAGMFVSIFWLKGAKWLRLFLYLTLGWLFVLYFSDITSILGIVNSMLLLIGGIIYTIGALVYAFKRPNPYPKIFGYHEIFHVLIVIASIFHYCVIYNLTV